MKVILQLMFFLCACFSLAVHAMISKRASYLQKQSDVPLEQRFRSNVADIFLQNELSGSRVRQLIEDHKHADKDAADDLLNAGSGGKHVNNIPRDMLRKLKKRTAWPPLYWAKIRVFDLKMQVVRKVWFPFILPHELIWSLSTYARDESTLHQHKCL